MPLADTLGLIVGVVSLLLMLFLDWPRFRARFAEVFSGPPGQTVDYLLGLVFIVLMLLGVPLFLALAGSAMVGGNLVGMFFRFSLAGACGTVAAGTAIVGRARLNGFGTRVLESVRHVWESEATLVVGQDGKGTIKSIWPERFLDIQFVLFVLLTIGSGIGAILLFFVENT